MNQRDEFKQVFFAECGELLADMEARLLQLGDGAADEEQLNGIFRCAHSIKGGAGAFGLEAMMRFTHALEAVLDILRDSGAIPSRETTDLLLASVDIVARMIAAAKADEEPPASLGARELAALQSMALVTPVAVATFAPAAAAPECCYHIRFAPHEELFASGNDPLLILRELGRLGELTIDADHSAVPAIAQLTPTQCHLRWSLVLRSTASRETIDEVFEFVRDISDITIQAEPAVAASEPGERKSEPKLAAPGSSSIRVDLDKIDRLVNMVGELVITEAMIRAQLRDLAPEQFAGLLRGVDELSHHTRELQEAVMSVRMQPVKSIFSRMPRIVRDTASQLGKDIHLVMAGENTEVDKTVIEQLGDPLTHMIRNCCDHGIETPEERRAQGKAPHGTIQLSAYHRSGRIIIDIADDGAGIHRDKVRSKAIEKGLIAADAALTDAEVDQLIFLPGFTTAEQVTAVSGRGVGMDVVRRNIEALGGAVQITSIPGKGSTFSISLPLTLAILDGMIVGVGPENYIVPITSIIETLRPKTDELFCVGGDNQVIRVRGEFIPLIYLHRVFGIDAAQHDASQALIVLVESGKQKLGLVVDELIGQQQVVIKSLEANTDPVRGISGATILGDGKVSLILEIDQIREMCLSDSPHSSPKQAA